MPTSEYDFRWNDWNINHIGEHAITPREAEYVVNHAQSPYPERAGVERYLVRGQNGRGEYMQVAFILDRDGTAYVIHARFLTDSEKRKYRRRTRG